MKITPSASNRPRSGTLEEFLAPQDIAPLPSLTDDEWNAIRRVAGRALAWRFCTLRNLWVHRGRFVADALGFAWAGIYRTLLVSSIVATSYRNEGLFRAGERIQGTGDFFRGGFLLPRASSEFREIVRLVNLRHHVAGVVVADADGGYHVIDGYEADYAYVATSFIEAIRRGMAACGLPPDSPRGRALSEQVCTVLYQIAGLTGLRRVPRDLAAHERFRDAYDRHLRERPSSPRVRRMAQEIARRIVPLTAAMADETVLGHVRRHLDAETEAFLFPTEPDAELDAQRQEWRRRLRGTTRESGLRNRSKDRALLWQQADVVALHAAYEAADTHDTTDRLIGAILLHALDSSRGTEPLFKRRTIDLAAGEPLIRQGQPVHEMYVILSATTRLCVLQAASDAAEPLELATLAAPTVLGEIGMWRNRPAVASVVSRRPNRVEALMIDRAGFEALSQEPGFRAATAAKVQQRLAINATQVGTLLDATAAKSGDPRLVSIAQLVRFLSGDSSTPLDAVIDLPDDAAPEECVEALRKQTHDAIEAGGLSPELVRHLEQVVATIG
jgi:CRP-like cAMP-binding protein